MALLLTNLPKKYNGGGHSFACGAKIKDINDADRLISELDELCKIYLKKKDDKNED